MTQSSSTHFSEPHWTAYYQAVAGRPPRDTLLKALDHFDADAIASPPSPHFPRLAVDLGCGDGRDTVELLRRGWQVLAVDGEPTAFERLWSRLGLLQAEQDSPEQALSGSTVAGVEQRLQTQIMRFEELMLPADVDLINASFCLPFCPPDRFADLWQTIVTALTPGGRFCGQLFGDRDSWTIYPHRTHHTCSAVDALLEPFVVEWLDEEEHPGVTAMGEEKHWHIFHIVARKK